jgi:hypothetical protein
MRFKYNQNGNLELLDNEGNIYKSGLQDAVISLEGDNIRINAEFLDYDIIVNYIDCFNADGVSLGATPKAVLTELSDHYFKSILADITIESVGLATESTLNDIKSKVATESKQDTGNTSLDNIDINIGAKSDTSASSDTGTFSLISLFKLLVSKITSLVSNQTNGTQKILIVDDLTLNGAVVTGESLEAGGSNVLGWLSSIRKKITAVITSLTDGTQKTQIASATDIAAIVTGVNTGVKGLRVYGGPTDPISDIPVVMFFDHHQVHEGESFRWSFYNASLGNNAIKDIQITVPNITLSAGQTYIQKCPHFRFEVVQSNTGIVKLYEAPTISVQGTQITPINLERNGTYTSKLIIKEDPTNTALGNLIWQGINTANKNAASELNDATNEFILKNNTTYLLRVQSLTASNAILIRMLWYEDLGV